MSNQWMDGLFFHVFSPQFSEKLTAYSSYVSNSQIFTQHMLWVNYHIFHGHVFLLHFMIPLHSRELNPKFSQLFSVKIICLMIFVYLFQFLYVFLLHLPSFTSPSHSFVPSPCQMTSRWRPCEWLEDHTERKQ